MGTLTSSRQRLQGPLIIAASFPLIKTVVDVFVIRQSTSTLPSVKSVFAVSIKHSLKREPSSERTYFNPSSGIVTTLIFKELVMKTLLPNLYYAVRVKR